METLLLQILAASYATLGLMLVIVTINFALWSVIIQGRRPSVPQLFDLTTKAVKRGTYELRGRLQKVKKLKNLGQTPTIPDVTPELERSFANWIYKCIHDDMKLDFRETALELVMSQFGCPNKPTLQKLLARFEGLRILQKKTNAKNSTRKLARDGYVILKELKG